MILNGKGGLTGCDLHGDCIVFTQFLTAQSDTAVCFRETIFAIVPNVFFLLLLFYCFCVVKSGGELEAHIQGVLIGGGSPRRVRGLFHCGHAY